jgi:hypothetical protein
MLLQHWIDIWDSISDGMIDGRVGRLLAGVILYVDLLLNIGHDE